MKYRKAIYIASGVFLVALFWANFRPGGSRYGLGAQRMDGANHLRSLAFTLIAYAEDNAENFPPSIGSLSTDTYTQYGFGYSLYAHGDHIRIFAPADIDASPAMEQVFAHYSYLATRDRCHLVVFERPGLWDDHTVGYIDLDLRGRWKWEPENEFNMPVTRVTEQQFAEFISTLDSPPTAPKPADSLVAAAESGDVEKVASLLGNGAPVDGLDQRGWSPLTIAVENGRADVVDLLISKGANPNLRDNAGMGRTALMRACTLGYAAIAEDLLTHGADVHVKLDDGCTALVDALPYPAIVAQLIAAGANVNESDPNQSTPLTLACFNGNAQTVRLLIDHGANLKKDGLAALDQAASNGHTDVIDVLLSRNIEAGRNILGQELSSAYAYPDAIRRLISAGADVNAKCTCPGGRTAVMIAAVNACPESVTLLVDTGADLNATDDNGYTALDMALATSRSNEPKPTSSEKVRLSQIIDTLRSHGAKESGLKVQWPEP